MRCLMLLLPCCGRTCVGLYMCEGLRLGMAEGRAGEG